MPKTQPPFDTQRYETLKTQGLSQRAIAEHMGMSEATLGNNLKVLAQAVAQALSEGLRMGDHGLPWKENGDVSQVSLRSPAEGHVRTTMYTSSLRPPRHTRRRGGKPCRWRRYC